MTQEEPKEPIALVKKSDVTSVVAWACGTCGTVCGRKEAAAMCCSPRLCQQCGSKTDERYWLKCSDCRDADRAKAQAEKIAKAYAKAVKINLADYTEELVCMTLDGQENDYVCVDDIWEHIDEGLVAGTWDEAPAYVWGTFRSSMPALDVREAYVDRLEEYADEADADVDYESLQSLVDEWEAKQTVNSFMVDERIVVVLPPKTA